MSGVFSTRTLALFVSLIFCLSLIGCQNPPEQSLQEAKLALDEARKAGALKYAPESYESAQRYMREALLELGRQRGRLALFRNYRSADSLLGRAQEMALLTRQESENEIANLRLKAETEARGLRNELDSWRGTLDGSFNLYRAERPWSLAELGLQMGEKLIASSEYAEALQALENGKAALNEVSRVFAEYADDAASKYDLWQQWVRETVGQSRRDGSVAIIVDKSAHKLYLLRSGVQKLAYDCDLGHNSARQKFFAGDGATPEGKYQVVTIKNTGSKYHKALLLNYPNARDKKRFKENLARGIISEKAKIGGLIEIHGEGGQSKDWTDGCVALENHEIDQLIKFVKVGTPVTIVRQVDQQAWQNY